MTYRFFASPRMTAGTLTALAAVLIAVSCARIEGPDAGPDDKWNELEGDRVLVFSSSLSEQVTKANFPDGGTFGVLAYFQEGDIDNHTSATWGDGSSWYPSFMYNQLVTLNGTNYEYSPRKYWPNNQENTISFWAYSPHNPSVAFYQSDNSTAFTNASYGLPNVKFTVTDGSADFMTSNLVKDQSYTNTNSGTPGKVKFEFGHRLSWIEFKAKPDADYVTGVPTDQQVTFKVKKIEILYSYNTADFHQNADNTFTWSNLTGEQTSADSGSIVALDVDASSAISVGTDPAVATACPGSDAYMIPQSLYHSGTTESGKYVTLRVTYIQVEGGFASERTASGVLYLDADGKREWIANSHYVYTFVLKPNDGLHLTVEVEKWDKWLEVSDYKENVTVTHPLTFDSSTYDSITTGQEFTIDGVTRTDYTVIALKSGTTLTGSFIFDTPHNGTWYAVLESINNSEDGSIAFEDSSNNLQPQVSGTVGDEVAIKIKARNESVSSNQYARLRLFCVTPGGQVVAVQDGSIGGPFVIAQYVN